MTFTEKNLISRFVETNSYKWPPVDENIIPLKGEICIVEIPANSTENLPEIYKNLNQTIYLIKYGDGKKTLINLPWIEDIGTILSSKTFILDCN